METKVFLFVRKTGIDGTNIIELDIKESMEFIRKNRKNKNGFQIGILSGNSYNDILSVYGEYAPLKEIKSLIELNSIIGNESTDKDLKIVSERNWSIKNLPTYKGSKILEYSNLEYSSMIYYLSTNEKVKKPKESINNEPPVIYFKHKKSELFLEIDNALRDNSVDFKERNKKSSNNETECIFENYFEPEDKNYYSVKELKKS